MKDVKINPIFVQSDNVVDYSNIVCGARILDICSKSTNMIPPRLLTVMAIMTTMLSLESDDKIVGDMVSNKICSTYMLCSKGEINHNHILSRLKVLSQLNDGWNNDMFAVKISPITIGKIKQAIANLDDQWLEGWNVFPCTNGSVIMDLAQNNIVEATINFAENGVSAFMKTKVDFSSIDNVPYTDESIKSLFEKVFYTKNICVKFLK